jgi:hypothetical protein
MWHTEAKPAKIHRCSTFPVRLGWFCGKCPSAERTASRSWAVITCGSFLSNADSLNWSDRRHEPDLHYALSSVAALEREQTCRCIPATSRADCECSPVYSRWPEDEQPPSRAHVAPAPGEETPHSGACSVEHPAHNSQLEELS